MSSAAAAKAAHDSGVMKGAILMLSLGYEQSAEVLKLLSDEQVQSLSAAIADLDEVTGEQTEAVLTEFMHLCGYGPNTRGGFGRARRMLSAAFGQETAKRLIQTLPRGAGQRIAGLESLEGTDADLLASFLESEHAQTVAVVLANLTPEKASAVVRNLPEDLRVEAILRLASLDKTSADVTGRVTSVLEQKVKSLGGGGERSFGGPRAVAEMMSGIDPKTVEDTLRKMAEKDEITANEIREMMFVFEDLLRIDAASLKEILKLADRKVLTTALKGTSEDLRENVFKSMSKRAADMMNEDMEALGPVRIKEVETAQKELILLARKLEQEGTLSLSSSETEQYVV